MKSSLHLRFRWSNIQRLGDARGTPIERHRGGYPCLGGTKRAQRREGMDIAKTVIGLLADALGGAAQAALNAVLVLLGG